jgi:hypothetical protein
MLTGVRKRLVFTALLLLSNGAPAFAQQSAMVGTPAGDIGVKVGENAVMHAGVAVEGGYDTNVFYNDNTVVNDVDVGRQGSATLRVIPSFMITNSGRDGSVRSDAVYSVGANLIYREYINDDPTVRDQRAFIPTAVGTLAFGTAKVRLSLADSFSRSEEPPYFPGQPTIKRDINQGSIGVGISPGGGRLTTSLRYSNAFDYFETSSGYGYASNMIHDGMLDLAWKWLPKTAIFLQGGVAYVHFLNPDANGVLPNQARVDSVQVRGMTGLRGLVTAKTTVGLSLGYNTAFYQTPPAGTMVSNPSGVSNFAAALDVGYIPSLLTRVGLTLQHTYRNSPVLGNFYDTDAATLSVNHSLGRLVVTLNGAFEYRRYHNYFVTLPGEATPTLFPRKDTLVGGGLAVDYYIARWIFCGASYTLGYLNPSDDPTAVAYTKQQIFARVGVAY